MHGKILHHRAARTESVTPRLYPTADPTLNSTYVAAQRKLCPNSRSAASKFIPIDGTNGGQTFDANYFKNIFKHQAVFKSDAALISTSTGRRKVLTLANSQPIFFSAFGTAMEKMGRVGVLTGTQGKIRTKCYVK
ncbi:hypothetical protein R1sor_023413 [Riccia sorocarpa]|uniref:Plant heme peroxidase family profile domain-containing protein n=1 Tax=Riccia sorocarpa TaxID=122646 RepID=A0ABD3GPP6_9MARC